jgi:PAS domain S-box-containing protein
MSHPDPSSLEVEIQALRAEIAWLQAERLVKAEYQALAEAYQHSQVRFRSVFEASPLGQKIIGPDLTIREANPAVAALLGLASPEQLLGRVILDFVHPRYQADWNRLREALWTHHLPSYVLESYFVRADGSCFWCRVTSVLFVEDGQQWGFTTLEDVTARKQAEAREHEQQQLLRTANEELAIVNEELRVTNEELLEANTHLAHTNADLDTFVYAASHDLKAPIINLESLMQALTQELAPLAPQADQVPSILGMMQQALERFHHTLDKLSDIGTLQGEVTPLRQAVSLAAVVEDVRQDLQPQLTVSGGQIEVDLAGKPSLAIAEKNLRSLVFNLVSNGLKYRHPDRAPVVRVSSQRTEGQVLLRVQDNGLGLSSAQQGQLFTLFKRLHSHVEGSGVGLYLVKKIVDHAGGSIRIESQLGHGSTFIVAFPAK